MKLRSSWRNRRTVDLLVELGRRSSHSMTGGGRSWPPRKLPLPKVHVSESARHARGKVQANGNVVRPGSPRKYPEVFYIFFNSLWMNPTDVVGEPLSAFKSETVYPNKRRNGRTYDISLGNLVPTWEGLGQHGAGKVTQSPKGNGSPSQGMC